MRVVMRRKIITMIRASFCQIAIVRQPSTAETESWTRSVATSLYATQLPRCRCHVAYRPSVMAIRVVYRMSTKKMR